MCAAISVSPSDSVARTSCGCRPRKHALQRVPRRTDGFSYHFDVSDDKTVSGALFDAAFDWARGRGLAKMWGPQSFVAADGKGLLVKGFEHRPALGIAYNYLYYGALVEDAGFVKGVDLISCYESGDGGL